MHSDSTQEKCMRGLSKSFTKGGMITIVEKSVNGQRFKLVHIKELGCTDARQYNVLVTGHDEKVTCSCRLYEHAGSCLADTA